MRSWDWRSLSRATNGEEENLISGKNAHIGASQVAPVVKNLPADAWDLRDESSIPGPGRSPRGGHSNPLQYFCLENPMDRGVWWATVHRVTKSWTWLKRLSTMLTYNSAGVSLFLIYLPSVTTYSVYDTVQNNKEATRNQIAVTRYRELKSQSESHLVVSDSLQPHGL